MLEESERVSMAPLPPSEMSLRCSWRGVSEGCMVLRCVLRAMEAVPMEDPMDIEDIAEEPAVPVAARGVPPVLSLRCNACLLYTSDAADE